MARVLVIDDEPDVLLLCRVNLEHAGHEVFTTGDADEGLRTARSWLPDVAVLDLMLGATSGVDVLEALVDYEATRSVAAIVLTARTMRVDRERCLRAGAAAYVTKPFAPDELVATIERLAGMTPAELEALRQDSIRQIDRDDGPAPAA